jgi:hypothetical protein
MKLAIIFGLLILVTTAVLFACNRKPKDKTDKEIFEEILNDPRVNSKEVGEREGVKYFQYMENGKTGFRDLDGKIVIKAIYKSAEMFSEGHSAVEVDGKWGLINEKGEYVLKPQFESLGGLHNGLLSFRTGDKCGFIDIHGNVIIEPKFYWVDEFSEGFCAVSTDFRSKEVRKYGYIDTTGKLVVDFQFQHANKFENGQGKIQLKNLWGAVDKTGKIVVEPKHKYTSDF